MSQVYAILHSGKAIPLSTRTSTSFFREGSEHVFRTLSYYPKTWGSYLSWLHTVPNWNSANTAATLNKILGSPQVGSVVLYAYGSEATYILAKNDILHFKLR